jgi:hypothetical protein
MTTQFLVREAALKKLKHFGQTGVQVEFLSFADCRRLAAEKEAAYRIVGETKNVFGVVGHGKSPCTYSTIFAVRDDGKTVGTGVVVEVG